MNLKSEFDTRVTALLEEVEQLIDQRFPAGRTDGPYHRVIARELARLLRKRCDEKKGTP